MESSLPADSTALTWLWLQQAVDGAERRRVGAQGAGRDVPATQQPGKKRPAGFTGPV